MSAIGVAMWQARRSGTTLLLAVIGLLAGCGAQIEAFEGPTMGSHYSLKYVAEPDGPGMAQLRGEVEAILAEVDAQMSTYRSDSLISRFNALPANRCQAMPASILDLVRFGESLSRESAGAFDLTVEPLLDLWGFGPQSRGERVPSAEEIAAVRANVGFTHLRVDGQQLCKDAAVQVDFDSIAAGYTVDRIAQRLDESGVRSYLLSVTGELKVRGRKPDGSPWRVAIEAPREAGQEAQQELTLDGYGVSTSGDYRNYFEVQGRRYSHTFDPASGAPVRHNLASVTVVDPSALRADGLSTLLMVLGPQRGLAFAKQKGVAALFIRREVDGFQVDASPAFQALQAGKSTVTGR
ncbi:FAD:protein FMN transferase [Pseudomonas sp. LS44]|uniref:FAD:protein FMN transferase n=1 Tax=Pseudomonas sp. LS44 TaxID=1357074 RepID=UPI00215AB01B|nr:FAD:protein FMN transferase [Pseudomonas sp. LS44]UVE19219.1 FAD:protein FMN transferase [Pseudomonas sp. LS44]